MDRDGSRLSKSERIRSTLNDLETKALDRLESLCKEIRTPGIECAASVRIGIAYEEILNEAEKIAPYLIVLGGTGGSALARILLGSTAERVVRFARCSVLVARHPPNQLRPNPAQSGVSDAKQEATVTLSLRGEDGRHWHQPEIVPLAMMERGTAKTVQVPSRFGYSPKSTFCRTRAVGLIELRNDLDRTISRLAHWETRIV
jgi:hypothetical protein